MKYLNILCNIYISQHIWLYVLVQIREDGKYSANLEKKFYEISEYFV